MVNLKLRFWCLILLAFTLWFSACGPEVSTPEEKPSRVFSFQEALDHLIKIETNILGGNSTEARLQIELFSDSVPKSFPMKIEKPFFLHSFHDVLMKDTRVIKNQGSDLTAAWKVLLAKLNGNHFYRAKITIALNTSIAESILRGDEPKLTTKLMSDFLAFSSKELEERTAITFESFWASPFLYSSDPGSQKEKETSAVLIKHDDLVVGVLEFKNQLVTAKTIDLSSLNDLYNVSKTPGYVSAVGRLAAYARFGIGEKMFEDFFKYARLNSISESYLHVRTDNDSAIKLYEKLGYKIVAKISSYYSDPPSDAHVMHKRF